MVFKVNDKKTIKKVFKDNLDDHLHEIDKKYSFSDLEEQQKNLFERIKMTCKAGLIVTISIDPNDCEDAYFHLFKVADDINKRWGFIPSIVPVIADDDLKCEGVEIHIKKLRELREVD